MYKYQIGEQVMTPKGIGVVEKYHDVYADWYWVRFLRPLKNAPFADEYPENATHDYFLSRDLCIPEPDDYAESPTVGNEVI